MIIPGRQCRELRVPGRSWRWLLARVTSMSLFWTIARMTASNWLAAASFMPWSVDDTERTMIA
jgi:hypothetical protein